MNSVGKHCLSHETNCCLVTGHQRSALANCFLVTGHQRSALVNCFPVTGHQRSALANGFLVISHQPSALTNCCLVTGNHDQIKQTVLCNIQLMNNSKQFISGHQGPLLLSNLLTYKWLKKHPKIFVQTICNYQKSYCIHILWINSWHIYNLSCKILRKIMND